MAIATAAPHSSSPAAVEFALLQSWLSSSTTLQLPLHAIEDLTQRVTIRRVRAHGVVVSQDEPGDALFVILNGRVKVVIFGEKPYAEFQGDRATLNAEFQTLISEIDRQAANIGLNTGGTNNAAALNVYIGGGGAFAVMDVTALSPSRFQDGLPA